MGTLRVSATARDRVNAWCKSAGLSQAQLVDRLVDAAGKHPDLLQLDDQRVLGWLRLQGGTVVLAALSRAEAEAGLQSGRFALRLDQLSG